MTSQLSEQVRDSLAAIRLELKLPAMFPPEVSAQAEEVSTRDQWPLRTDRRDLEFVTIDPPGSMDLDQAVFIESTANGDYVVYYAIADLASWVDPGSPLDVEVNQRGQTVYGPDARIPLHPPVLSEGAASLLPGEDRPAALWTIKLNARGEILDAKVERAMVRSRERLTYQEVQNDLDSGHASKSLELLADVGRLRQARERERGGVSLDVPEQEVTENADGTFALSFRSTMPIEGWNAQISLLTGIAAAQIMRESGVGILRTLPPADPRDLARLRRTAHALNIDWPEDLPYSKFMTRLDSNVPAHAAFLNQATTLFRGASYFPFGYPETDPESGEEHVVALPAADGEETKMHAALAIEYAHVTAPLRRLVDRYGTEVCLAHCLNYPVPDWVLEALPRLPKIMSRTGQVASSFERASIDVVEAALLRSRVGQHFPAVVTEYDFRNKQAPWKGEVVLTDLAVVAKVESPEKLPLGEAVQVTLATADVAARKVLFTLP